MPLQRPTAVVIALAASVAAAGAQTPASLTAATLMRQVEVRRTAHGVPHIKAENLRAAGYAEAYVQSEDYGPRVALSILRARGEMGRWFGRDSMNGDFVNHAAYARAIQAYPLVDQPTRDVYDGFAVGLNRYIELHPNEFIPGFAPHFTGYDILAKDVDLPPMNQASKFVSHIDSTERPGSDDGSNAWAFGPSRTKSKRAILLRNPHLVWTSGYYEAHVVVPGVLDFYGDLRIGGPFGVIGGFNHDLGWATTNNDAVLSQIYEVDADTTQSNHYWLDGASLPLDHETVTVTFKQGAGFATELRETYRTSIGPVVGRTKTKLYVFKAALDGEFRAGEQFLKMMQARTLAEWKAAMRIRARLNSSFTYADRAGNIFYLWNAAIPDLPQPNHGDTAAVPAHQMSDVWTHYVSLDSLPQVLNPKGGYVHNENDPPYYTNMRQPLDPKKYPDYFPAPKLGLRSQLAISLIDNDRKMSLEDVVKLKHSYRMLLADRVRDDLVAAVRATKPTGDVAQAIGVIAAWDKTVAPESRGGTLFEAWWRRYSARGTDTAFAVSWSEAKPTSTPRGIRDPKRAVEAFAWAADDIKRRFGAFDVKWGDVHRVRRGTVDVPVGGCSSDLGCFRVLTYRAGADGKYEAIGSDGWILAVEFGKEPRAYSILAYGESPKPDSPYFSDQAEMFARGQLKPVAWNEKDIEAQTIKKYHPGEAP
ncbi:MAG: penicillin acylase family protein [bacterium]